VYVTEVQEPPGEGISGRWMVTGYTVREYRPSTAGSR
jgi:hypothetical protein